MGKYTGNRPLLRSRVQAGLDVLRANPMTDTGKVLAIGFCFGGTTVLESRPDRRRCSRRGQLPWRTA